jgi:hypothetical protein
MKMYLKLLLTIGFCLLMVACKTAQLTSKKYEGRATTTERSDSMVERDSVLIWVYNRQDTVKIVKREVKFKDRIVRQHDTLTVLKTDTIIKIVEPKIRSPSKTLSKVKSWINTILAAVVIIIVLIIILKLKQLWDRLI